MNKLFEDGRSKSVLLIAHCIINQNSVSDGTASSPGYLKEFFEMVCSSGTGIVQMPCPELHCLGLNRGDPAGAGRPVTEENTRIGKMLKQDQSREIISKLVLQVVHQIKQYLQYDFEIKGIIGINRSPSCGVESTSADNKEVCGEGIFISELRKELEKNNIKIKFAGIKTFETENALKTLNEKLR